MTKNNSIGMRLLRVVFGFYLIVTVSVTGTHFFIEFQEKEKNHLLKLQSLSQSYEDSIGAALWNYDSFVLDSVVLGLKKVDVVGGVAVVSNDGEVSSNRGFTPTKSDDSTTVRKIQFDDIEAQEIQIEEHGQKTTLYKYTHHINYKDVHETKSQNLGRLYIFTPKDVVIKDALNSFIVIIINAIIKSVALWLIFLFFVNKMIARPLGKLTSATQDLSQESASDDINEKSTTANELEDIANSPNKDELQILSKSFLDMKNIILNKINSLHDLNKVTSALKDEVEEYNLHLEQMVEERTQEIKKQTRDIEAMLSNMQQGLLTVGLDYNINSDYSKYTEEVFETTDIAGKDFLDLIFSNANISDDDFEQLKSSFDACIGTDLINFDFNSHNLIRSFKKEINGQNKHLNLDWNAIVEDDKISKMMITVRDITKLVLAEEKAAAQARELTIVGELLSIKETSFREFRQSGYGLLTQCKDIIAHEEGLENRNKNIILRNLHTLKGNARTLQLKILSDAAHIAESHIIGHFDKEPLGCIKTLNDILLDFNNTMHEYLRVYDEVLKRSAQKSESADHHCIDSIKKHIEHLSQQTNDAEQLNIIASFKSIIEGEEYVALEDVLNNIVASIGSIAEELDKPSPKIELNLQDIQLLRPTDETCKNVLTHILRNAIDHGIETPEERLAVGKPEAGNIKVEVKLGQDAFGIHIKDDGRGLNLQTLYEKATALGLSQTGENLSNTELAEMVFQTGLSTKLEVSNISGRGIGLSAVKDFLQEAEGDISIKLDQHNDRTTNCPFELVISLPNQYLRPSNDSFQVQAQALP